MYLVFNPVYIQISHIVLLVYETYTNVLLRNRVVSSGEKKPIQSMRLLEWEPWIVLQSSDL
jgi:hypothetical protein